MNGIVTPKETLFKTVHVRIDIALLTRVDIVCKQTKRTRSDVIRQLIDAGLGLHEAPHPKR